MSIKCARMATLLGPCLISLIIVGFSFFVSSSLNSTLAQTTSIVADDTLPGSNNSLLTEIGNRIDISGGHNVGSNLFHSFSEFQVGSGDTASFQSQGAANILSRVTGSDPSNIFGTIGIDIGTSTQSQANLFFMNPNGIVFGPSARLDLKGSFHVTTADFLRLQAKEEGGRFSADPNGPNKLIEADPNGFGFLSGNPTGITVNGSLSNGKSLEVLSGKTLSIIGGPVTVDNALLQAPSGQINVVSAASGEEAVVVGNINEKSDIVLAPQPGQGGKINFNSTVLETSSSGTSASGRVVIRGGELVMKGASPSLSRSNAGIYSVNSVTADTSGRTIDIKISGSYQLTDGGVLDSGSKGAGKAGDIFIGNFGELTLTKGAQIDSSNFGSGDGGRITLKGKQITITDQASVTSTTTGAGSAGVITLTDFEQFALSNGAKIVGSSSGSGESGIININEGRTVEIADGARIANEANGTGNSRSIGINVTDLVKVSNADISTQAAPGSTGQGGDIDIQANQIKILDGTRLSSQAEGEGAAGSIRLLGTSIGSSVTVSGEKVVANMFTPSLLSASSGATVAEANYDTALADATTPRPGQIIIQGDRILLQNKATVTSSTSGAASGGDITLRGVEQLTLANEVSISSTSSGSGNSGAIIVDGKSVTIVDGARLDIQTLGAGDARFILMTATDLVRVASADISAQATPNSTGRAGAIDIQANQIQIVDGTRLSGQAMGEGAAGSIRLLGTGIGSSVAVSGEKVVGNESTPSLLTATSGSAATRANYDVAFAAAFKEEPGKEPERIGPLPGEIILEADQILLQDSATITSATDGAAPGGNVTLQKFEQLTVTNGSTITSTSSGTGESGAIVVNGKTVTIADGARLEIEVEGTGDSRFIGITATETVRVANADISTKATPNSKGRAGSIDIEANRIQIVEGSQLSSQALGEGAAGGIRLRATDTTEVSGGQVRDGQFRVSSVEASSGSAVTPENYNAAFADAFKEEPGKEPERIGPLPGEIILEANQIILQMEPRSPRPPTGKSKPVASALMLRPLMRETQPSRLAAHLITTY